MAGTKLALLKRAMGFVIQNLGPSDRLSVVAFSSAARRLFPLRRMSECGRQQALQAVNSLTSGGGTNIAEGLRKGAKVIEDRQHKNPVSSIILLSDGQDTYTVSTTEAANGTGQNRRPDYQSLLPFSSIRRDRGSGSYPSYASGDRRTGYIDAGDLYADEERDFLVSVNIPPGDATGDMTLLKVGCVYKDPVSKEIVNLEGDVVQIKRPEMVISSHPSIRVDRQRNRLQVAEAMAEARSAAERGDLSGAVSILEVRRNSLVESVAGKAGDRLCMALDAELKEMQERMASRQRYEASGRAYVLSGLSSHSWQRATARGDSTDSTSLVQSYQTPSMVNMLARSQTLSPTSAQRRVHPPVRPARSFQARPQPR
ncbi:hypothetical protein QJS10_CPB21g00023 [Acorus calamus]|uniref:VWFA domain-containing protein n=1 Tax=Acorus calamus TaxID=4465 RepID=A0AAV9C5V7_ACOCL|nr:hypothetical protein QJS10_CPB21g00023 [Acorus calamus]